MVYLADTSFLIDFEREDSKALSVLAEPKVSVCLATTSLGELAMGRDVSSPEKLAELTARWTVLQQDLLVCYEYGQLFKALGAAKRTIAANDLWIAAHAIRYGLPVLTANETDFRKVPGLSVISYR